MKELFEFLRKHKVLTKYKKNFIKYWKSTTLESFCKKNDPKDYFNRAFTWKHTPEGYEFWSDLSVKWRATL